jgi:hypothetical protein
MNFQRENSSTFSYRIKPTRSTQNHFCSTNSSHDQSSVKGPTFKNFNKNKGSMRASSSMKKNENPPSQNQHISYNDLVANSAPYNKQIPREGPSNPNQYVHRDRASSHKNMNSGKFTDKKLDPSPAYSLSGNLSRKDMGYFPENEFGKTSTGKGQRHRLLGDELDSEHKNESIKNYNLGRNHEIKSVVENITNKL